MKKIFITLFVPIVLILSACETTYTALGVDYIKWDTLAGNGNFKNNKSDSFYIFCAPFYSSNVAATPPTATCVATLKSEISKYAKATSSQKPQTFNNALTAAKSAKLDYLLMFEIDGVQNRNMFSLEGDSMVILISLYKTDSSQLIYRKSAKIVASNRGLTSSSLSSVARDTLPSFVKTMFR